MLPHIENSFVMIYYAHAYIIIAPETWWLETTFVLGRLVFKITIVVGRAFLPLEKQKGISQIEACS